MKKNLVAISLLAILVSFNACKKDNGFGSDLLPGENPLSLNFDDSTVLTVSSKFEDPLRTDRLLFNYLGHTDHPVFGQSTANTSVQFGLPSDYDTSLAPFTVKDVSMYLFYDGWVGDTTQPVTFSIHTLTSPANTSIIYNSDFVPNYNSEIIGEVSNYLIKPNTPQKIRESDTLMLKGLIKFPLDLEYGVAVKNLLETGNITNDTLFNSRFPGLYIETSSAQKGKTMIQLDLTHLSGGVYLNMTDSKGVDQIFILPFTSSEFVHTGLKHDYDGTRVNAAVQSGQNPIDDKLYIQSQAGVKTEVVLNNIERFKGKLINKAVLEIFEVEKPLTNYYRTLNVFPILKGAGGQNVAISDYTNNFYGPTKLDTLLTDVNGEKLYRYQVNITRLMNDYALGKVSLSSIYLTNYPVFDLTPKFIVGNNSVLSQYIEPASLIFGGPNYVDKERKMKFKVWYSEVSQ
ncbi:MAG TPA: DUF4270 family protein [Chitinophagales bacterium]|nr:DUF4270 family protein [Chitinophagales bacterium]